MSNFIPGDIVLDVRKLVRTSLGSPVSKQLLTVVVADVRKGNMQDHLEKLNLARRSSRVAVVAESSTVRVQHLSVKCVSCHHKLRLLFIN